MEIKNNKAVYKMYLNFCKVNSIEPISLTDDWIEHWREEYLGKKEALEMTSLPKSNTALLML